MIVDPPGTQLSHVSSPARFVEVLDLMCNIQVPADFLKATEVRPSAPPESKASLAVPNEPCCLYHICKGSMVQKVLLAAASAVMRCWGLAYFIAQKKYS